MQKLSRADFERSRDFIARARTRARAPRVRAPLRGGRRRAGPRRARGLPQPRRRLRPRARAGCARRAPASRSSPSSRCARWRSRTSAAIDDAEALFAFLEKATTRRGRRPAAVRERALRRARRALDRARPARVARHDRHDRGRPAPDLGVAHPWLERATQFCVARIRSGEIGEAHAVRGGALLCETLPPALARELEPTLWRRLCPTPSGSRSTRRCAATRSRRSTSRRRPTPRSWAGSAASGSRRTWTTCSRAATPTAAGRCSGFRPPGAALAEWRARRTLEALRWLRDWGRL